MTDDLHQDIAHLLETNWFHGKLRNISGVVNIFG